MAMQRLGERIKKRRESLNMHTNELATSIGVTSSLISQIERAKAYPSILTLKKIADALKTTVGELIGEFETLITNPLMKVKDRKFVKKNEKGASLYLLSHHDPNKYMDTFLIDFKKSANSTNIMTTINPSQEFCYVLKGRFKVVINTNEFTLEPGDSFYFNSNQYHLFTNIAEENSHLLWIVNQTNI